MQTITVHGTLTAGHTVSYQYEMGNPALVTAGMVYDRLRLFGVKVTGQPRWGPTPETHHTVVAEHHRPLLEVLSTMLKHSDNRLAEYVFKMIGGSQKEGEGTARRSHTQITQRMAACNVDFGECRINDGSGLSRANLLSASALTGILEAAWRDKKVYRALYDAMSVAGVDGTLRHRMRGTRAQGNVHGKTGTLRNASALTGFVTTRDGEMFAFTVLCNGNRIGSYRTVQDRIATTLAEFSYSSP